MAKYDDAFITEKLGYGGVLTAEDIELLLDDNTAADNLVKKSYHDLMNHIELQEYIKDKTEQKAATLAVLNSLIENYEWRAQLEKDQLRQKLQQQQAAEYENQNMVLPEPYSKNVIFTLLEAMFEGLTLAVRTLLMQQMSNDKVAATMNPRAIKAMMHLCAKNHDLKSFIFSCEGLHSPEAHAQQIFRRFMHITTLIEKTPIAEILENIAKLKENAVSEARPAFRR